MKPTAHEYFENGGTNAISMCKILEICIFNIQITSYPGYQFGVLLPETLNARNYTLWRHNRVGKTFATEAERAATECVGCVKKYERLYKIEGILRSMNMSYVKYSV